MHRFPNARSILASETAASVIVGWTRKVGAIRRNSAASSGPQPYTVIPVVRTAEETAGLRMGGAAVAASRLVMRVVKAACCCQRVSGFRDADDMFRAGQRPGAAPESFFIRQRQAPAR